MSEIPKPRHRITIQLNCNNMEEFTDHLRHIQQTLGLEEDERLDMNGLLVIGGGYSIENEFNPDMTAEKYKELLLNWHTQKKDGSQTK